MLKTYSQRKYQALNENEFGLTPTLRKEGSFKARIQLNHRLRSYNNLLLPEKNKDEKSGGLQSPSFSPLAKGTKSAKFKQKETHLKYYTRGLAGNKKFENDSQEPIPETGNCNQGSSSSSCSDAQCTLRVSKQAISV